MPNAIDTQHALIFTMVTMSGVEGHIGDTELKSIGRVVKSLPVFKDFDAGRLAFVAKECMEILQEPEGLDAALGLIVGALSPKLRETAYALAVETAAADRSVHKEELRFLAILRDRLGLDKLVTAAIERSAIARYQTE